MASLKLLPPLILMLSLLSAAAQPPPPHCITNAEEALAASGYIAMSLTLHAIALTLPLFRPSATTTLTIFSPADAAFTTSGQPSLAHLLLHFSPIYLSPASLISVSFSSTLPSLSPSKRLTVTSTSPKNLSINSVGICDSPIFDDGFVIVYAIDNFFDLNFTLAPANSTNCTTSPKSDFKCLELDTASHFEEASGVMKSRGYSIMASFLDLQLIGFRSEDVMKWTVFAPVDEELVPFSRDFLRYSSLFMRHLIPCKAGWKSLDETANGTVISNNVMGFGLEITKDEDGEILMVNGVEITFPDMYDSEWLVIHGIRGVIALSEIDDEETEYTDDFPADKFDELVPPEF